MSWSSTPPRPREIQVEVTGSCNLRCRMCLVRYRPTLNKAEGSMSFEDFRRVLDELPEVETITLQGLGEPLLCPDLDRMIDYATARGARMGFNTNGTLLTRERAERLVRAGLGWLHISVDGATAPTYEGVRDGSSFERVHRNVTGLVEVMRELEADRPELEVVFVAMRRNVHELPDVVRLTGDWGIGRLWVQNLSHSFSDTDPAGDYDEIRRFAGEESLWSDPPDERVPALFEEARRLAGERGVHLRLPRTDERPRRRRAGTPGCDWPWRSAYVGYDGSVLPCCMVMGSDRATLGNAFERPFGEIWQDDPYVRFREGLLGENPPEVCVGCSMYRGTF